jgi:hypothetical protein
MMNGRWGFHHGRSLVAAVLLAVAGAGAAPAATVTPLDDFEGGLAGLNGTLATTGPVTAEPRPNTLAGMRISHADAGACDNLIGTSRALCGADTLKWAGFDGARLSCDLVYGDCARVAFDLAAWSVRDPFDPADGDRPDEWGDHVRVQVFAEGAWWLLAEFTGSRVAGLEQGLVSTGRGVALGAGQVVDAQFRTLRLAGPLADFRGAGTPRFDVRTTGSAEQIGIDNIRLLPIPLPASLPLALLGVAALGMLRGRQRHMAARRG